MEKIENNEKVLTRKISITWSLSDIIKTLTRSELDLICKTYSIKGISKLKKDEVCEKILAYVPEKIKELFNYIDINMYKLLKEAIDNNGVIKDTTIPAEQACFYQNHCLMFAGVNRNKNILFVPKDICKEFKKLDGEELESKARKNSDLINYAHGIVHYYGILELYFLYGCILKLTGVIYDHRDIAVIETTSEFYNRMIFDGTYVYDANVKDHERLLKVHNNNPNIIYYSLNKEHVLEASEQDFVEETDELFKLFNYLANSFSFTEVERKQISYNFVLRINDNDNPFAALDYLKEYFSLPSEEYVDDLLPYYADAYNSIRQWELKGNTPKSLNLKMIRFTDVDDSKESIFTNVGRNEPCPCGSGKKFKKCCGK